ncbi:MAG: HK97 gp10 family phage protein [Fibrobacter sp.]|nr:HK97 gp10 family phage protein [Fibrobacter sp.]
MGLEINVNDNSEEVLEALKRAMQRGLTQCGMVAEGYAKLNLTQQKAVDSGDLRKSITFTVKDNDVYIGTNIEYAAYVEMGTGKYVPGGRKDSWSYQDAKGNWHRTNGMPPRPYLKPAAADHAQEYTAILEAAMRNA